VFVQLRTLQHQQNGWSQRRLAEAWGVSEAAVSQWMRRPREGAPEALCHQPPPGAPRRLSAAQLARLPELWHRGVIDFLLTEPRDTEAALRFLMHAIRRHGVPETVTINGSDANEAAIKRDHEDHGTHLSIRQVKYVNNLVEQDHRGVKRVTRPMLGFKSFEAAQVTLIIPGRSWRDPSQQILSVDVEISDDPRP
jgi:hypothetical protein